VFFSGDISRLERDEPDYPKVPFLKEALALSDFFEKPIVKRKIQYNMG
jgi:hypothetical protein